MKTHTKTTAAATTLAILLPAITLAQVPVDADGNLIGSYESAAEVMPLGDEGIPMLGDVELQDLVGPIALYPDDLLAVVLPASAYPLQIAAAARFLEELEVDPTLQPDPDWDDSIVALLNYPEVVELLNDDLDWTWRLGEAVVAQQTDVIAAVEGFRDRAYAAGNLRTDEYQTVSNDEGYISIAPASEDVIYVPYYEPERVVYYQPRPAYFYYPRPCPVYYYPYSSSRYFDRGRFWGVTTAFSIGWYTDSLNVHHHSYRSHPYYGHRYWNNSWYRHPTINVYNNTYVYNSNSSVNVHTNGDRWRAREDRREYDRSEGYVSARDRSAHRGNTRDKEREPVTFRKRDTRTLTTETARRKQAVEDYRRTRQASANRTTTKTRTQIAAQRDSDRSRQASRELQANREAGEREAQARARSEAGRARAEQYRRTSTVRREQPEQSRTVDRSRSTVQTPQREQRQTRPTTRESSPPPRSSQPSTRSTNRSRPSSPRTTHRSKTRDRPN